MNKNWLILAITALMSVLGYVGYQFYVSLTMDTNGFNKTVIPIESDLGTDTLNKITILDKSIPVRNESLDNK